MSEQAFLASPTLARLRYVSQGLLPSSVSRSPLEAARLLACAQGQHLGGVVAALALRSTGNAADVEAAFNSGEIVRGYPMRGTVFAVSAADMQWMTTLAAARTVRGAARRRAELELPDNLMARITDAILSILSAADGEALERTEIGNALAERGIPLSNAQRYHVFFTLIASGILVYGPLRGREHLVVSAKRVLPQDGTLEARFNGDELAATAEWLRRYLLGHGPATLRDFSWWTKLPLGQTRKAMQLLAGTPELQRYGVNAAGEDLWGAAGLEEIVAGHKTEVEAARLLPPFDEYLLGYQDRSAVVENDHHVKIDVARNGVFKPIVYSQGQLVGTWARVGSGKNQRLEVTPFDRPLSKRVLAQLQREFAQYPRR